MHPVDIFVLYTFIRKLSTPFEQWKAYSAGLIDAAGNFLVPKEKRTAAQKDTLSYLDVLILNIKKWMLKIPGGATRIATFAAALFLLREGKILSESTADDKFRSFPLKFDAYLAEAVKILSENEGGVPANNISGGAIQDDGGQVMNGKKDLLKRHKKLVIGTKTP